MRCRSHTINSTALSPLSSHSGSTTSINYITSPVNGSPTPGDRIAINNKHNFPFTRPPTYFTLVLINIRSIINKLHLVRDLIACHAPDILLITESWCSESTLDCDIALPGYALYRKDRASGRGGGCLIYTSSLFKVNCFHHPILDALEDAIWITVNYRTLHAFIGCIYRAPSSTKEDTLNLIRVINFVADLPFAHKLIAGDFNMPDINWTKNSASNNAPFLSAINVGGWKQHVRKPTRSHSILDLIFTLNLSSACVEILGALPGCDHRTVKCLFKLPLIHPRCQIRDTDTGNFSIHLPTNFLPIRVATAPRPSIGIIDWSAFQTILRSLDWSDFFSTPCPVTATRLFIASVVTCLDKLAPICQPVKKKCRASTANLKFNKKLNRLKFSYSRSHDFSAIIQLAVLQDTMTQAIQNKLLHEERTALSCKQKSLAISQLLRRRNPRNDSKFSFITTTNNLMVSDPQDISELFSTYFTSTFTTDDYPLPLLTEIRNPSVMLTQIPINLGVVRPIVQTIKPSLMSGPDGIPPAVIKFGSDDISLFLCKIFNVSLESGVFPSQWKTSVIIPRHKSGPLDDVTNYRPINHTPISSRILEKIIKRSLFDFLASKGILNSAQHGFINRRSCATCHLDFFDFITSSVDKGLSIIVVYLDMNKAFDRVPHHRLLLKLRSLGVGGSLLNWFSSFLSERNLVVKIGNEYSSPKDITSGVIQGSVLGPILFLIYVNDIFDIFSFGKPFMFADDLKIAYAFHPDDLHCTVTRIQKELNSLDNWSSIWQINFSPDKSGITVFKCSSPVDTLTIKGKVIASQNIVRDLGLRYSCSYSFSHQVTHQLAKCRQMLGIISRVFRLPQARLELYKSHVRPLLEYSFLMGGNLRKCDRVAIESVQRAFTKYVVGFSSTLTYRERCIALPLEPLWLRRMKLNLTFLHNILYCGTFNTNPLLKLHNGGPYCLRNKSNTLVIPKARTSFRAKFFSNRYAALWNRLPPDIRAISNTFQFKMRLHKFFTTENILHLFQVNQTLDSLYENGPDYI